MAAEDIKRLLDPSANHYVGSRFQQGRALTDSDANEGWRAREQDTRRSAHDVIGGKASPDHGFLPDLKPGMTVTSQRVRFGAFVEANVLNYNLQPGAIHIGGWRFQLDAAEPVVCQKDYLQIGPGTAPRASIGTQRQLSYLRGWEQPVTAIEDGELLEPALQGADGAVRIRRTRRVETRTVEAEDCAEAFEEVLSDLGEGLSVTYDPQTCELRSNARLRLSFIDEGAGDCDGCDPTLLGKYLGSENHIIKLMLASSNSFVWAFDNGAPVYRAKLLFDETGATVVMLTPPKDTFHEPVLNAVVEFLPWTVLLDNAGPDADGVPYEKLGARVGFFAEVDAPYDPGTSSFHARLDANILAQLGLIESKGQNKSDKKAVKGTKAAGVVAEEVIALEWDADHPHASKLNQSDPNADQVTSFVYLRVWHVKKADEPLTIPTTSTAPLGRTGIKPTFTGMGRPGDYWRGTVRVAARDQILPWTIMDPEGVPPDGPREVIAPLSLVEWSAPGGKVHEVVAIHDCRPNLPALTTSGCCTYVVGTGHSGHFQSIQAAIDALPPRGGHICILPGTYREEISVIGRGTITISGCGRMSVLETPERPVAEALVSLQTENTSQRIILKDLSIEATDQISILTKGPNIDLKGLTVNSRPSGEFGMPNTLRVLEAAHSRVTGNTFYVGGFAGLGFSDHAVVYLSADDTTVFEDNNVTSQGARGNSLSWGGVHVAGGSRNVEIRKNRIAGGHGHGITLGSVRFRATDGRVLDAEGAGAGQTNGAVLTGVLNPIERADEDRAITTFYPEPDPAIEGLLIADNDIRDFGGSGIGALAIEVEHSDVARAAPLCIRRTSFVVERLQVRDNLIEDNANVAFEGFVANRTRGGIVLSEVHGLTLMRNRIRNNGATVGHSPNCGLFIAQGSDFMICDNVIIGNGSVTGERTAWDLSGGVVLAPPRMPDPDDVGEAAPHTDAMIRANTVEVNKGQALFVNADSRLSVFANTLQARFSAQTVQTESTVTIINPNKLWEAVDLPPGEPNSDRWEAMPVGAEVYLEAASQADFPAGGVIFTGNTVTSVFPSDSEALARIPVGIASGGNVTLTANQFSAVGHGNAILVHCFVFAAAVDASHNRVSEGIEMTRLSLGVIGVLLTLAADNVLTHCPLVISLNQSNSRFHVDRDNLTWFDDRERPCGSFRELLSGDFGVSDLTTFGRAGAVWSTDRVVPFSDILNRSRRG